jgi:LPXTG-motif cell wall-anchored protein
VAIIHTDGSLDDARLSDALVASGVAVVCIAAGEQFETGLAVAAEQFDAALPRMVAASGAAVAAGQRAAKRAGLTGAVLMNAPVGRSVGRGSLDTILFVDRELLTARVWGRVASWFGNASFHVVDTSLQTPLRSWLADPTAVVRDPLLSGSAVGTFAAAAAIMAMPVMVAPAIASADSFDGGVSVSAAHISGDGTGHSRTATAAAAEGNAVPASAITGDGTLLVAPSATGSIGLVGGNGLKWFVNTNITFGTTSSASGAMSEASFTSAHPVTTSAGGTVNSTLNDAFDGYNALFVDVAGTHSASSSNNYNQNGVAPTMDPSCSAEQVLFPVKNMLGLDVSREVYVPADGNYARWLNVFTNPTDTAITVAVGTGNNFGSDSNTIIDATSSGDLTSDLTDTWVGTFQNYSGSTSSDVRLGHVIQGAGAAITPSWLNFTNGDDNSNWAWDITVQPGETITLMNFVVGENSKAAANATAAELAALTPGTDGTIGALRCMDDAMIGSVRNYAQPDVTVAPVSVNEADGSATVTFTRTTAGAAATVTFTVTPGSATTGSDYTDPVTLTATFAAGATTATVTIPVINDGITEPAETLIVTITGITGFGRIAEVGSQATVTINDPVQALPATGSSTGALTWLGALLVGVGASALRVTRRRRTA